MTTDELQDDTNVAEVLTTGPSLRMRAITWLLRLKGKRGDDAAVLRQTYDARDYPEAPPPPQRLRRVYDVTMRDVDGWPVYTVTPKADAPTKHIIYLHGGSYVHQLNHNHWNAVTALAQATGAQITVPLYPLAPEYDHAAAFALVDTLFTALLTTYAADDVILCGDSAGAGLALGFAIGQRDQGGSLPGRLILFAPWLDITMADPAAQAVESSDVMLKIDRLRETGRWWAGGRDPRHPILSPLFANLTDLPPIDIYQGTADVFIVDTRRFACRAEGAVVTLYEFNGAFHAFPVATFLPEAKTVYRRIARDLQ
ncbi:alpha/beta hydrolase [Loktanella agnita]|uniref:alpha/beta hydrolase n=1 Tax=Loktanella agnita TaxID=287097 RepID=UPI003985C43A